jgi:inner membrane protein
MAPKPRARVIAVGVVCSVLPDIDVIGFRLGISYGDVLGHRGLTHSLAFAFAFAVGLTALLFRGAAWERFRIRIVTYLFLVTASHGVLDALTNGGLGVAFLAPFDPTRWFLPFRPVLVSPIGVAEFFTSRAVPVLASELWWIVLPWSALCVGVGVSFRAVERHRRARARS